MWQICSGDAGANGGGWRLINSREVAKLTRLGRPWLTLESHSHYSAYFVRYNAYFPRSAEPLRCSALPSHTLRRPRTEAAMHMLCIFHAYFMHMYSHLCSFIYIYAYKAQEISSLFVYIVIQILSYVMHI